MDAEFEGVPVSATEELREQLWDWADQILDLWNIEDTNPPSLTEGFADRLLPLVASVVAEARTEGAIAELEAVTEKVKHDSERAWRDDLTYAEDDVIDLLVERAAALRGVGNQKVERWSANRLEEVLREGLPDQNAEPEAAPPFVGGTWADQKGTEQ